MYSSATHLYPETMFPLAKKTPFVQPCLCRLRSSLFHSYEHTSHIHLSEAEQENLDFQKLPYLLILNLAHEASHEETLQYACSAFASPNFLGKQRIHDYGRHSRSISAFCVILYVCLLPRPLASRSTSHRFSRLSSLLWRDERLPATPWKDLSETEEGLFLR